MKTIQLMERKFFNKIIHQRTSDAFFNATDLLRFFNEENPNNQKFVKDFWNNKNTKDFIEALENDLKLNGENFHHLKTHESSRGKGGATWMHPYLFVKFAMWLSPRFELEIIKWVYDNLIDFRICAGDNFKKMCAALSENLTENERINPLCFKREANMLNQLVYGTFEPNKRNTLNENELKLMNELQELNIIFIQEKKSYNHRKELLTNHAYYFKKRLAI